MVNWFQNLLKTFKIRTRDQDGPAPDIGSGPPLDAALLEEMVKAAVNTHDDELDCDQCFDQLDAFVELYIQGKPAKEALPLVDDHLQRCKDCREEFEALRTALRAMA